jgi:hypothetical protein
LGSKGDQVSACISAISVLWEVEPFIISMPLHTFIMHIHTCVEGVPNYYYHGQILETPVANPRAIDALTLRLAPFWGIRLLPVWVCMVAHSSVAPCRLSPIGFGGGGGGSEGLERRSPMHTLSSSWMHASFFFVRSPMYGRGFVRHL